MSNLLAKLLQLQKEMRIQAAQTSQTKSIAHHNYAKGMVYVVDEISCVIENDFADNLENNYDDLEEVRCLELDQSLHEVIKAQTEIIISLGKVIARLEAELSLIREN